MTYKVVIADDEPLILKNLKGIIDWHSLNCEVMITVKNGQEVMDVLQKEKIDLLLTDISMPEMTGIEVLKRVHSWPDPPLAILLSGYDEFSYAREGLKYNALDYFLKPIDYDELEACIQKAIKLIQEQEKQAYDRRKQLIYDQIMSGIEVSIEQTPLHYISLIIWNPNQKVEENIEHLNELLSSEDVESYSYKTEESQVVIVLAFEEGKDVENEAKTLVEQGSALSEESKWAIGSAVEGLNFCKDSVDEAKSLIKLAPFTNERIITKDHVDHIYASKSKAIEAVERASFYMKNHFYEDLSIEQVAREFGVSVSYFSQLFKQKHGMTFLEYIRNERIDYACMFLKTSDLETYKIAEKVGYVDQRYFSQVFKKKMKVTPSEYRRKHK